MEKEFWDFDENINYIIVKDDETNSSYKVLNIHKNFKKSAEYLIYFKKIIYLMCIYLYLNKYIYDIKDHSAIECFLDIHFYKQYLLSEMQIGTQFNGINKPRQLYKTKLKPIGDDGSDRATYRHIFLTLRHSNGKFKTIKPLIDLLIHELTHTMCNHIRWRNDDHGKDFIKYEKLLTDVYNKIYNIHKKDIIEYVKFLENLN